MYILLMGIAFLKLILAPLENYKRIIRIQNRNLRRLVKKAYKIPFYKERFDKAGVKPCDIKEAKDLTRLPVLTKEELRNWVQKELDENPSKYDKWVKVTTSGSTGIPLMTLVTKRENAILSANWIRISCRNGLKPLRQKTMALKDPDIINKRKGGRDVFLQKFGLMKRVCIPFFSDAEQIVETINSEKPDYIYIHRSKLVETLLYVEKNNVSLHVPSLVGVIGEGIDNSSKELIEKHYPGIYFSSYGTMEAGACTYTRKGTSTGHILTRDTHIINVVDDNNELCNDGHMIITNLFMYGFPIINYDIKDDALLSEQIGNNIPLIMEIKGRMNDRVKFRDGSSKDWLSFYTVMEKRKDILQFRVIQNDYDTINVQLVKNMEYVTTTDSEIVTSLEREIRKTIPYQEVSYSFEFLDELKPDKNGKRRYLISKIGGL